jgi:hypothetical protein
MKRKKTLVDLKGGKCEKCDYQKNLAALEFHHIRPELKSFQLDLRSLSNRSMERILSEAAKCMLVCSNCHAEIHYPNSDIEQIK